MRTLIITLFGLALSILGIHLAEEADLKVIAYLCKMLAFMQCIILGVYLCIVIASVLIVLF